MNLRISVFAFLAAFAAAASAQEVYMSGLANPRGMTFSSDGTLYVAEAGFGGGSLGTPFTGPGGSGTFGLSGGVSSRNGTGDQTKVLTGLPSIAGINGKEATGAADLTFTSSGQLAILFGLGGSASARAGLGSAGSMLGTLSAYDSSLHGFSTIQDYAAKESSTNPDGGEDNSNPFGLAKDGAGYAVADGGGNVLWRDSGATVFPSQLEPNPFGPGMIPQDAVPTSVLNRAGGGFLVSTLGGFPFTVGESRIFEVGADGSILKSTKFGLTSIVDMIYGGDGSVIVAEIYGNGLLAQGAGDVKRINPDGSVQTLISGLLTPTSLAMGTDGFLYVTNNGVSGSGGQVLRYAYQPVPEPASMVALGVGVAALLRRRRKA